MNVVVSVLLALVIVASIVALALSSMPSNAPLCIIVHDGQGAEHVLALDADSELMVDTVLGHNVVRVEQGEAHMVEADCPGGDCLHQQAISHPGQQLICLPHKLWVEVVPIGTAGGAMDLEAAAPEKNTDVDVIAR